MEHNKYNIDHFFLDGVNYYRFFSRCPVDNASIIGEASYWVHKGCGGDMYIGDNATFYCKSCEMKFPILNACFECPEHSKVDDYTITFSSRPFNKGDIISLLMPMLPKVGIPFLIEFLKNL